MATTRTAQTAADAILAMLRKRAARAELDLNAAAERREAAYRADAPMSTMTARHQDEAEAHARWAELDIVYRYALDIARKHN